MPPGNGRRKKMPAKRKRGEVKVTRKKRAPKRPRHIKLIDDTIANLQELRMILENRDVERDEAMSDALDALHDATRT